MDWLIIRAYCPLVSAIVDTAIKIILNFAIIVTAIIGDIKGIITSESGCDLITTDGLLTYLRLKMIETKRNWFTDVALWKAIRDVVKTTLTIVRTDHTGRITMDIISIITYEAGQTICTILTVRDAIKAIFGDWFKISPRLTTNTGKIIHSLTSGTISIAKIT